MEGVAELVIEQVCYFPDSRRFLFTWLCMGESVVCMCVGVCVYVCDLVVQTKRAYIRATCVHTRTAVHTYCTHTGLLS